MIQMWCPTQPPSHPHPSPPFLLPPKIVDRKNDGNSRKTRAAGPMFHQESFQKSETKKKCRYRPIEIDSNQKAADLLGRSRAGRGDECGTGKKPKQKEMRVEFVPPPQFLVSISFSSLTRNLLKIPSIVIDKKTSSGDRFRETRQRRTAVRVMMRSVDDEARH